jgi:hypothetical protein
VAVPVPQTDEASAVTRMLTGLPVSSANHSRWNNDLLYLNCRVAHPIISEAGLPSITTGTHAYYVAYKKSPGVNCLRITVEANVSASGTRPEVQCAVTTSAGSVSWVESGTALVLDGSNYLVTDVGVSQDYPSFTNTLDVSALTDGTIYDLIFTIIDKAGGSTRGLYAIHVTEVPLADVDPIGAPTTDLGADASWLMANDSNRIVDGTTSISYGMIRVCDQLETARYKRRRHWQVIFAEDSTVPLAASTSSTVTGNALPFPTGTPTFRFRSRALYGVGASTPNTYLVRIRYRTSTTQQPWIRFAVTPVGGAVTNTDYKLAHSSGAWTATTTDSTTATMTLSLPNTGTAQEFSLTLGLWNDTAGTVYVSQVALIESHS